MGRARKLVCALAMVLVLSSCATPSIEEMGRDAIREQAAEGMEWFKQLTAAVDTSDRDRVRSRFQRADVPHSFGWDPDGVFYTDRYYREHLTTSGG